MAKVATEQSQLESLQQVLADVVKDKDKSREISQILTERHSFHVGVFEEILTNHSKLGQLSEDEIAVLILVINEVTKDERVDPETFYNQRQIGKAKKFKVEQEEEVKLPYTFESVLRTSPEDYLTVMSYKDLAKLWNANIITYNFQTQRLSKKKMGAKGNLIEKADVNQKSVKNIVRLMQEGKYRPSTILLNVLVDGKGSVEYDDGELTVNEGSEINIIDGFHRLQAILRVIELDPDFEGYMNIDIKHYPLEVAQQLLAITNTVNRFDKTLVKTYLGESIGAMITKELMGTPELRNRISIKTSLDKKINYLTNFAILSESIESIFEPKDTKDRFDYAATLKKFFGYLITHYGDAFGKNKNEVAKTSWFVHHNMFVGFVVIAKKLYDKFGKDFPVDEIVRVVDSINFSKEESELNDILTSQGKVNSNQVKRNIRKFFEEKVDQILG